MSYRIESFTFSHDVKTFLAEIYADECAKGKFAEHFMGNRKINTRPKSMRGLITNLRNSDNNTAPSGYAGTDYTFAEVI